MIEMESKQILKWKTKLLHYLLYRLNCCQNEDTGAKTTKSSKNKLLLPQKIRKKNILFNLTFYLIFLDE